jgi:hypothetical protein
MARFRSIVYMAHDDDKNNRETVFYYSRERRLNRASPKVQAMNDGKNMTFGRAMFGPRANKLIFFAIVIICIFGLTINMFTTERAPGSSITFGGNRLSLAIFSFEEALILAIVKNAPERGEFYTGEVEIAVSPAMPRLTEGESREIPPVFSHRLLFRPVDSETFHISLPFDENDFFVLLRAGEEQRSIRLRPIDTD